MFTSASPWNHVWALASTLYFRHSKPNKAHLMYASWDTGFRGYGPYISIVCGNVNLFIQVIGLDNPNRESSGKWGVKMLHQWILWNIWKTQIKKHLTFSFLWNKLWVQCNLQFMTIIEQTTTDKRVFLNPNCTIYTVLLLFIILYIQFIRIYSSLVRSIKLTSYSANKKVNTTPHSSHPLVYPTWISKALLHFTSTLEASFAC